MFCRYCGREIQTASCLCENCGKEQREFLCTNGYFGILEVTANGIESEKCQENTQRTECDKKDEVDAYKEKIYLREQLNNKERKIIILEAYFLKLRKALLITIITIIILVFVLLIVGIDFFIKKWGDKGESISSNIVETESDSVLGNTPEGEDGSISENILGAGDDSVSENISKEKK